MANRSKMTRMDPRRRTIAVLFALTALSMVEAAFAQGFSSVDDVPSCAHKELRLRGSGQGEALEAARWATSTLLPAKLGPKPKESDEEWEERALDWGKASCRYGPFNLVDQDAKTAWCEGDKGSGIGAVVAVRLGKGATHIEVSNGFQKTPRLYGANGRVRQLRVTVLSPVWLAVEGDMVGQVVVRGEGLLALKDAPAPQRFALPKAGSFLGKPVEAATRVGKRLGIDAAPAGDPRTAKWATGEAPIVLLEIRDVYTGAKYSDTCLAEVK